MKQYLLLLTITLSISVFSQEIKETEVMISDSTSTGKDFRKNEIKINAAYLLYGHPEITYERILSEESSMGLSIAFSIDEEIPFNYSGIMYYRFYFGKTPASGFFFEGNGGVFSVRYVYEDYNTPDYAYIKESINDIGIGIGAALGGKFMTKKGWIGEIFIGGMRPFIIDEHNDLPFYPRLGLNIGKRF